MATNICVIDDYHFGIVSPQPVMGIYALGTVVPAPDEPVAEPAEPDEPVVEPTADPDEPVTEVKVVESPAKTETQGTKGVETK